jgi:hypothetical protein
LLLLDGRMHEASVWAEEAITHVSRLDAPVALGVGRIHATISAMRQQKGGIEALRTVYETSREMGTRLEEARALMALGTVDPDNAEIHFDRAESIFEECGSVRGLLELADARAKVLSVG